MTVDWLTWWVHCKMAARAALAAVMLLFLQFILSHRAHSRRWDCNVLTLREMPGQPQTEQCNERCNDPEQYLEQSV